ncbi:hypothetical protein F66182_5776 [Fusarium sp. NRRL 66182]|nr:hypothetical protein F66182_5776 [Fusarium sp. NRRL 66182]
MHSQNQNQNQNQASSVEARRLKKRELDRKAQRLARERTKSRIAQLESMVDNLRQNDSNAQIATLMDQLAKVTKERDDLIQVLDSLGSTIRRHLGNSTTSKASSDVKSDTSPHALPTGPLHPPLGERVVPVTTQRAASETSNSTIPELPMDPPVTDSFAYDSWNYAVSNEAYPTTILPPQENAFVPFQGLLPDIPNSAPQEVDVIVPQPPNLCHCTNPTSCASDLHGAKPNIWRAVNEVLQKPTKLSAEELAVEEYTSEDVAVRAILEGWDSVERAGKMTPTWRKLRQADELCFTFSSETERLAVMRIMHLLITYHGDPTVARRAMLPRWYWNRPSQDLPHTYGIDFFVWPGLRERLVFSQHQYCTNAFWEHLSSNLRILWPQGFQQAFYHDAHTGKYQLTPMFDQRIRNINAWTMSPDFFSHFPELSQDIPAFMDVPSSVGGTSTAAIIQADRYRRQEDDKVEVPTAHRLAIC